MKKTLCYIVIFVLSYAGYSQKTNVFRMWEDSLITLRNEVMNERDETLRLALNEDFMTLLEEVLQMPNAMAHSWDSVTNFSILASPDGIFKIFTWYVTKSDFTIENFGFIQVYNEGRKKNVIYPLYDKSSTMDYPKTTIGNHTRWYGSVYYRLIPCKVKNYTYYTLLGWNGNDMFTNQKVIEILHFNKDMVPIFGSKVFKGYPERVSRVIFEYSKNAVMHLNYETQQYEVETGKYNPKTRQMEYKVVNSPIIIFDELIPMEEGMEDVTAFLVPESSLNQGFIAEEGHWLYVRNVRGSNPDKVKPDFEYKPRKFYNSSTN